jgi:hypothetical protein
MPCTNDDFWDVVDQLPEVAVIDHDRYSQLKVRGKGFGYHWPTTSTAGLKQLREEHIALVTGRPDVFETQFEAGQFGWVVVHLDRIEIDELAELVFEAWRLTAPIRVAAAYGSRPPSVTAPKQLD